MTDDTPTTPDPQLLTAVRAALRAAEENDFDHTVISAKELSVDLYEGDDDVATRACELAAPEEDLDAALDLVEKAIRHVRGETAKATS